MSALAAPGSAARDGKWIGREITGNPVIYLLLGAFVSSVLMLALLRGDDVGGVLLVYTMRSLRAVLLVANLAIIAVGVHCLVSHQGSPIAEFKKRFALILREGFLGRFLLACVPLTFFMAGFLYCKMLIPELQPFAWDAAFAAWDQMLFAGRHPWEVLQPVLGFPPVTFVLDYLYSAWVPLVFVFWAGLFASHRIAPAVRQQFWLATLLSWMLIGLCMAVIFSSAGPCYFSEVVPGTPSPYLGLEAYLAQVSQEHFSLSSAATKEFLWQVHTGQLAAPGGISAMPSMHNAQAVLFAAVAYRLDRRFGHLMAVYAVLIFLGSIHLAWHYAVDGLVGGAMALAVWKLAGALGALSSTLSAKLSPA